MADDFSGEAAPRNLFGEVWYETAGKRGRPPFQRTLENANKVNMLQAAGWSNERIAACILDPRTGKAVSVKTLKRYFSPELEGKFTARDRLVARRLLRLWEAAEGGSVAAEKLFGQLLQENDLMDLDRKMRNAQDGAEGDGEAEERETPVPRGKKEAAQLAAETAGTGSEWGSDLLPGMVQ